MLRTTLFTMDVRMYETAHSSRFANILVLQIPGLMKATKGESILRFFDPAVEQRPGYDETEPHIFQVSGQVNVIERVRQATHIKCQSKTSDKLDKYA